MKWLIIDIKGSMSSIRQTRHVAHRLAVSREAVMLVAESTGKAIGSTASGMVVQVPFGAKRPKDGFADKIRQRLVRDLIRHWAPEVIVVAGSGPEWVLEVLPTLKVLILQLEAECDGGSFLRLKNDRIDTKQDVVSRVSQWLGKGAAGDRASIVALHSPREGMIVRDDNLPVNVVVQAGVDAICRATISINDGPSDVLKVEPCIYGPEPVMGRLKLSGLIKLKELGGKLNISINIERASGAKALLTSLTVWRPNLEPAWFTALPLVVNWSCLGRDRRRLEGQIHKTDGTAHIELWNRGEVRQVPISADGSFKASLTPRDDRVHVWLIFDTAERPDAYLGTVGKNINYQFRLTATARGEEIDLSFALPRSKVESWFANGRPIQARPDGDGGLKAVLEASTDLVVVEGVGRRTAIASVAVVQTYQPLLTYMRGQSQGRKLRLEHKAGKTTLADCVRFAPVDREWAFVTSDGEDYRQIRMSELASASVSSEPSAKPAAGTSGSKLQEFLRTLPPAAEYPSFDRPRASVVVTPSFEMRPPPKEIERVVLLRPGVYPTDELYVLRPLEQLLRSRSIALDVITLSDSNTPSPSRVRLNERTVVIVSRNATPEWLNRLTRCDAFIVYLMDDDPPAAIDSPGLPEIYRRRMIEFTQSDFQSLVRRSDRFLVTSPGLMERYPSRKTVIMHPPYIRAPSDLTHLDDFSTLRIAYQGTGVHKDDIEFLYGALANLLTAFPHVRFDLISALAPPSALTKLPNFSRMKTMPWPEYVNFVRENPVHINLAPMLNTPFNRGKSVIKYFDTASLGAVGVFSRVMPFDEIVDDGVDGFLVDNDPLLWRQTLRFLINNPLALANAARRAQENAHRKGNVSAATETWRTALLGLA